MVTGTTLIDHRIRAELNLSLQEYTIMCFLQACKDQNLEPKDNCIQMIAANFSDIESVLIGLGIKGFVNFGFPTDKWTSAFGSSRKTSRISSKKGFVPPTLDEVKEYFKEKGYSAAGAQKAFDYYSVADWADGRGNKVKNWKQKMLANWFKDEYKQSQSTGITLETKVYNK